MSTLTRRVTASYSSCCNIIQSVPYTHSAIQQSHSQLYSPVTKGKKINEKSISLIHLIHSTLLSTHIKLYEKNRVSMRQEIFPPANSFQSITISQSLNKSLFHPKYFNFHNMFTFIREYSQKDLKHPNTVRFAHKLRYHTSLLARSTTIHRERERVCLSL